MSLLTSGGVLRYVFGYWLKGLKEASPCQRGRVLVQTRKVWVEGLDSGRSKAGRRLENIFLCSICKHAAILSWLLMKLGQESIHIKHPIYCEHLLGAGRSGWPRYWSGQPDSARYTQKQKCGVSTEEPLSHPQQGGGLEEFQRTLLPRAGSHPPTPVGQLGTWGCNCLRQTPFLGDSDWFLAARLIFNSDNLSSRTTVTDAQCNKMLYV